MCCCDDCDCDCDCCDCCGFDTGRKKTNEATIHQPGNTVVAGSGYPLQQQQQPQYYYPQQPGQPQQPYPQQMGGGVPVQQQPVYYYPPPQQQQAIYPFPPPPQQQSYPPGYENHNNLIPGYYNPLASSLPQQLQQQWQP
jgi:hypothetical protein